MNSRRAVDASPDDALALHTDVHIDVLAHLRGSERMPQQTSRAEEEVVKWPVPSFPTGPPVFTLRYLHVLAREIEIGSGIFANAGADDFHPWFRKQSKQSIKTGRSALIIHTVRPLF